MSDSIIEIPRSKEIIDHFENVPVNRIWENTIYKRNLNITSKDDFEVSGLINFTIEPRCTMEEIFFTISNQSGKLEVKKIE